MVIADTGFWLALANRRDRFHEPARAALQDVRAAGLQFLAARAQCLQQFCVTAVEVRCAAWVLERFRICSVERGRAAVRVLELGGFSGVIHERESTFHN